jgi:alkanesulfonate monooxygenase SsuD/methylene tetrahydromethanopterin reductase-like flavin-dependent oxidoreductase (luciferase family)
MNEQDHDVLAAAAPPTLLSPGEQMRAARERAGRELYTKTSIMLGLGETDDEIVDAFAHLLLAVSRERPAIAHAPGASSPRETGGEDRSYVG